MEIKGMVHCFFEQSGTFKNEFIKLGIPAEDYDIQNNFGETDHVIDLFAEIENGYNREPSIFDRITPDDLVMAFFPCTYFETIQMVEYQLTSKNHSHKGMLHMIEMAIDRLGNRTRFHELLYKLVYLNELGGGRLIIENPATQPNYLIGTQNFPNPTIIDRNRANRGDYFTKPTAYWFFGCEPTTLSTIQENKELKIITNIRDQLMRSMISPDYARNFICDFILGKPQKHSQLSIFD